MYIYKLKYLDRETAIADLIAKGVYIETDINGNTYLSYAPITQSVVDLGVIDGYHFDVMVNEAIDFGTARVTPTNVKHAFLGFNTNEYNQINPNTNTNETTTY
jgi:hypothetical protein